MDIDSIGKIENLLVSTDEGLKVTITGIDNKEYLVPVERIGSRHYMRSMNRLQDLQDIMGPEYENAIPGTGPWLAGAMKAAGTDKGELVISKFLKTVVRDAVPSSEEDILDFFPPSEIMALTFAFSTFQFQKFATRLQGPQAEPEPEAEPVAA